MLTRITEGVRVHASEFMQSNAVVVDGASGVLLIDPGVRGDELAALARDLGGPVALGFSTHPHWDHLLWHPELGSPPRYGTAPCAAAIDARLSTHGWEAMVAGMLPPELAGRVPVDELFGRITGLAEGATRIPWDGPEIRVIEHRAHAAGHAALLIEERGVLVAGDMLSDILIPTLNPFAPDPIDDYRAALQLLEDAAPGVEVVIPGHGSVGGAAELRSRITLDRAYLDALRDGRTPDDPRLAPSAPFAATALDIHERQARLGPS